MKITVNTNELREAVKLLSLVVGAKATLPCLHWVRFESTVAGVQAYVTNLDENMRYTFNAGEGSEVGACLAVAIGTLKTILKTPCGKTVAFEVKDGKTFITHTIAECPVTTTCETHDPNEMPPCHRTTNTAPADNMMVVYRALLPFSSSDTTRYVLNGVYFDGEANAGIATDGRRLTMYREAGVTFKDKVIVPLTRYLCSLRKQDQVQSGLLKGADEKTITALFLEVAREKRGRVEYWTRLVDGTYPNYAQVIPNEEDIKTNTLTFTGNVLPVLRYIDNQIPRTSASPAVAIHRVGKKTVVADLKASSGEEVGSCRVTLTKVAIMDSKLTIAVSAGYLSEAVALGFTTWRFADDMSPLRSDNGTSTHVLMPMRVQ